MSWRSTSRTTPQVLGNCSRRQTFPRFSSPTPAAPTCLTTFRSCSSSCSRSASPSTEPLDAGTWVAGYFTGQHQASFSFNQAYKTPHFALPWYRTGGITGSNNYDTKYYSEAIDAAIGGAAGIFDEEERRAVYIDAQTMILESDPAFLNVFNVASNTLYYSNIQRTMPGPGALDGSLLREWWIDA